MKGRASQIGPESCVSGCEVWDEALTGVLVGQVSSRERLLVRDADAVRVAEGNMVGCAIASALPVPRVGDLGTPAKPLVWEPGDLMAGRLRKDGPHREGRRAEAGDARS